MTLLRLRNVPSLSSKTEQSILANGRAKIVTVAASKFGKTELVMKATGGLIKLMAEELSGTFTAISMKVNGSMTRPTAMEPTHMLTERDTKVTGKTICSTVTV